MTSDAVAAELGASDVLVAPSVPTRGGKREGIPVVLMEAMATGLPVVASRLSGIPELVTDEVSGLLVPPGDDAALADALARLAADPDLRRSLGAAGRATVQRDFDVDRNAAALAARIRRSLGEQPPEVAASGDGTFVGRQCGGVGRVTAIVFWAAVALVVYTYVGFPLLVLVRARLRPRPHQVADITPSVSVVIAAHDEAASIGPRVDNLLALDYPADKLEIVIASDGSTDATVEEARRRADPRVRVLDLPRTGKATALNTAVGRVDRRDHRVLRRQHRVRARRDPQARPLLRGSGSGRGGRQPGLPSREPTTAARPIQPGRPRLGSASAATGTSIVA